MDLLRITRHLLSNFVRGIYHSYLRLLGVKIGNNTMISLGAKIDVRRGKIIIGDNVHITYGCVILSHDYTAKILGKEEINVVTKIEDNCFIGVNSVILPGITVGRGSIIGAGSVVTKDIPPFSLATGNPAKVIKNLQDKFI
jgi:acetyltransferase-like isoleucine patch superfamily enzyme